MRYSITKGFLPRLRIHLQPQEALYADPDISRSCGPGIHERRKIRGRVIRGLKRSLLTGRSPFLIEYRAQGAGGHIDLCSGKSEAVVPVTLHNQAILCRRDSFLAFFGDMDVDVVFSAMPGSESSGPKPMLLQKISGSGTAFLHADDYIVENPLRMEEMLRSLGRLPLFGMPGRQMPGAGCHGFFARNGERPA